MRKNAEPIKNTHGKTLDFYPPVKFPKMGKDTSQKAEKIT
jgi:hypothetical protein